MITYLEAKDIAATYIKNIENITVCELIEDETIEESFGWVFFYNSKEFLETGDFSYALIGNAPIIVDRLTGIVTQTGTAYPIEYYINQYQTPSGSGL